MLLCCFTIAKTNAQDLVDYDCSSTIETYVPLGSTATALSASSVDDGYATLALPFTFSFGNATFTSGSNIYVCTNGYISLNASYTSLTPPTTTNYSLLCPLGHDLHTRNGSMKYQVTGTAPNRVLTVEWNNFESYTAGNTYNFQVKIYEQNSTIKFCYGNSTVTAEKTVYCFLREYMDNEKIIALTDWNNPTFSTTSTSFSKILNSTSYPSSGRTYTFSKPSISCPKPITLSASNITAYSADISWIAGGTETSWDVYLDTSSVAPDSLTPPTGSVTDTFYTFNLTPNTVYYAYVRANCGSEYSRWRGITFTSSCIPMTSLPFLENFDAHPGATSTSISVNNLPSCWANINHGTSSSYTGYPAIYSSSSYAASGTNAMRFYVSSTAGTYDDQIAILPSIDPTAYPLNTLQLSFDARSYSSSYTFQVVVGVMTDPNDANTFVPVNTISTSAGTYANYEIPLSQYTGSGSFIAVKAPRPTSSINWGLIDNIMVDVAPNCSRPTQVTVGNITTSSVTVNWTPGGQETVWEVACVPQGQDISTVTPEQAYAHPHTINNLNDDTHYEVYVRAVCPTSGYSSWTPAVSFTTDPLCTPPTNVMVDQIMGTSALVSWTAALVGADSYTVEYSEHGLDNWVPATVSVTSYMLSGLTPETSYDVRVFSNCQLGDADTVNTSFVSGCLSMTQIGFEDGTSTTSYFPVSNSNNYTYSQQLWLASELNNTPMDIKRIAFEYKYSTGMTAKNNVDIYLGHTTQNSFVTTTSWVPFSNLKKVYHGNLNCHKGWNTFVLDSTFHYNGLDNLVLVVDDNSGSSNGSTSYTFLCKSQSPNYMTIYYYSGNANPQSPPTATSRSYNRNNVRFMSECDYTVTCIAPNAYVSDVTESSITVDWVPGNNETAWQMEYSTNGTTWTPEGSVTAPYTLSTLTPNTLYYIRLRSDCGGVYSGWTTLQAQTPCSAATIPLTENFDNAVGSTTGNMVDCWGTLTNYTSAYPYASTSYKHSGTHSVYFYGPTPYYSYLISPRMDDAVQMNNLEVSFWAYKTSANYFIQVGVMSDPDDPNTFVQIGQNISPSATSTWESFDVNTSLYTGQGKYIAFRVPGDVASYMYIDDIDIHAIPTCPRVTNLHTTAVSSASANLAWTAGGTENEWIVVYGPAGSIVNPEYELATASTVYTPSFTLNSLNGGTLYDVYVKAVCNASDSSFWSQYTFRTDCGNITNLPYTEDFESFATSTGGTIYCWTRNGLYSSTSYPYVNTSYHTSGTKSLYFYLTTNSTYTTFASIYSSIALPPMDPTIPVNTLEVSFKMRASATTAKMIVGVMTNPSDMTTFTPVQTITPTTTSGFESVEVDLSSYTGTGTYIALKTNFSSSSNVSIDDIRIDLIPTCKRPINVAVTATTTNSATINWTPRNGENDWQVVVVPHGQPVTNGTPEYATQYPYTVQNLTDATMYDVYVKADCGNNDMSDWSDPVKFHTKCFPTSTIPYFESFEGVGSGSGTMPICWTAKTDYVSTTEYPYVSTSYHSQGSTALYFYKPAANYMYATSQALDLSNYSAGDLAISYKLLTSSNLSYARMDVGIMTDPDDPSTFTRLRSHYTDEFAALNTWYSFSVPLNETYSTPVYVAFYAPVSTVMTYMYVDEVKVDAAPTCSAPMNLTFSQISGASVLVSWLDSQYGDGSYTVEYTSDNVTWNTEVVTGTHVMLTGLTQQTPYHVRVYRNCANGTPEVATGMFTTSCYSNSDVEFTDGAATTYYIPVYNSSSYNYSYSQQLFLASEMGGTPMDIKSIAFEYKYATALTSRSNVNIYLGHTTKSTFSSTSDWVPYSDLQLVYSGNLNCTMGWNTFVFNSVFHYNGTSNLVVVVDDNSNATSNTSYVFTYKTQSPNYRTLYYYNASTNPNPQSPPAASSRSYYRNNIKFLTLCDSTVTCYKPNVYISDRDHESIEVTWAPGGTESSWEFEYKAANDVNWTQVQGASSPQIISGLTSNTVYNIRLRSDCGGGDYSLWRELTAETECAAITVPYVQNFDSTTAATGAMVPCWTRGTNNSTAYPYLYATYSESAPNSVYFYTTSAYYAYLASPRFDATTRMDSLLVRFKARRSSTTSPQFIEVGIMTDPNDYSTFTPVGTFAPSGNTLDFENGEVRTSGYTGNGRYVAFRSPKITNTIYLDDVQIDYIPNCLHVENVHAVASTITATSADVTWTPGGDETEWSVVVAPAGSVTNPSLETPQIINGTPSISLSNLTGNTPYEVFVQGHCSNGENSVWEIGTFRTACVAISSLPFEENFEGYAPGSSSNHKLPPCWDYINAGSSATGCPTIQSNTTYAAPGGNGNALYFYSTNGTSYADQIAILPEINTTLLPMNTLRLYFDARRYNTTTSYIDYVELGVMEGNQFVLVDTVKFTSTTISTHHVDFSSYTGTGNRMAIRVPRPTGTYTTNYNYLDNIKIDVIPSCSAPTHFQVSNLTPTSADLSWTDAAMEGTWQLLVVPANQTPNFTQAQIVTSNTYSLSSLNVNTRYKAYLRTECSNGQGYSEWISTNFTTPCNALTTLPFSENFDTYAGTTATSVSVNNLPSCWANYNNGTSTTYSGYPIVYNNNTYAASGSNSLRFYTYITTGTYDNQVAVLPPIDVTLNPWSNLMMSFDARALNTSYTFELVVGVMTNPSDMSTFVPVQTIHTSSTTYDSYEISFVQYTGTGNFIAIKAPQPASGYNYGYVDNILVDVAPTCSPVHNLTVSQIAATSALLSWDDGMFGTPSSYTVEYAVHGSNNWTPASYSVTASPYLLGGLSLNTNYDVRVKANCTDGSSSNYWVTKQFSTQPCLAVEERHIGNGTATSSYLPGNSFYNYSLSEQLFTASELGGATTFNSISLQCSTANDRVRDWDIYLLPTTATSLTGFVNATSSAQLVYSGRVNIEEGWFTIQFDRPFAYNGTSNLILIVDDNTGSYTATNYYYCHTSTHGSSYYIYNDGTNYNPASATSYSPTSTTNRNNIILGGVCDTTITCVAPNVYVRDVTTTTATVDWAPGYTESQWSLEYQVNGAATWTTAGTQTSSPVTLTGLTPGTPYKVRMRSECGGNDVSDWVIKEFSTECLPIAQLPFTENFDSYSGSTSTSASSNNLPLCWNYLNNGTSTTYSGYPIIYSSTASAYSGSNSMRFYTYITAGAYDDQILVLPQVDVNANAMNTLQLSFDARNQGSYTFQVVVGVMTDPRNKATFVPVDTIVTTSNVYANYDVLFDQYTGTGSYIALMAPRPASSYNAGYVDNITVDLIPSCPKPHDLTVTNVTTSSASLSWTEMGSAYNWNVQYGPAGFALGSGTTIQVQNTPSTTITGLNVNTSYDFYVQADCMGGDTSYWTQKATCVTPCNTLTQLPFVENFDNVPGATTTSVNVSNLPSCWYNINTGTYSGYLGYPIVYNNSSYANSGLNSLRFYAGSGTYGSQMAILPPIDATLYPMATLQLSLDARALNTSYPFNLEVGVLTNPLDMTTFVPLTTISTQVTTYANYEVPFSQYTGSGNYIGIRAAQTTSGMNYGYVDNIRVELIPTCPKPSNVAVTGSTQTSVTLSWTENGSATHWNVQYGPAGFTLGAGTTVQASTNPFTVTNLSASTTYDFYVQADCLGGDVSNWSQKATGATQCDVISQVPYTENFDNYGTGTTAYPNCWSKINTYTGGDRPYCNTSSYGGSVASLYFFATSSTYNIAIMPEVSSTIPVNTLKVNFMLKGTSSYTTPLSVGVMTNPLDASTYVEVATVPFDATITNWVSREVSFANYTGTGHYIAFKNGSPSTSCYTYIDNLVLDLNGSTPPTPPTCATPTGLAVAANTITQTTATATWNAGGTETAWDLQYKLHNATSWGSTISLTAPTYPFTGLTAGTFYDVRVRANCGGETSAWTNAVTFQTQAQGPGPEPCSDPTNMNYTDVTTNSVVLDWTENGTSTSWIINYQELGVSQQSTVTANEHPYTLTGLQPATTYQAYVVANCDDGPSGTSNMVTFTTLGVGIEDYELATTLYPNPNNGQFTVYSEQSIVNRVQVYDVYGKLLKTVEVNSNTAVIDAQELASGMYFVRISTEKGMVTKSFVKK